MATEAKGHIHTPACENARATIPFHRFEYTLFGDKPTGYYLLNIFIHPLNAFLLYLLIRLTLRDFGLAFMRAVLFAFSARNYGHEVMYAPRAPRLPHVGLDLTRSPKEAEVADLRLGKENRPAGLPSVHDVVAGAGRVFS